MAAHRAGFLVEQPDAGDDLRRAAAFDFLHHAVPDHADLRVGEQARLEDFLRAQRVAAVDQGNAVGVVCEVERLLHGGVAAADHGDALATIEEAITGGAGGHAAALQALFRVMSSQRAWAPVVMITASAR